MRRNHRNPKPPKRTAPGAQDAQKADQSKHHHSAPCRTPLPEAVLGAIDEAQQAGKWAIRALQCGNVMASIAALDQAMRAMSAAASTVQGLAR
jgi:hypothetical protein